MLEKTAPDFTKTGTGRNPVKRTFSADERGIRPAASPRVLSGDAPSTNEATVLDVSAVSRHMEDWILDCQFRQHSIRTVEFRQHLKEKLLWFLEREEYEQCGVGQLRAFLAHVANGHEEPGGRWGNPRMIRPVRSATIHSYYRELRVLFNWMVEEGMLTTSPVERINPPKLRSEQVQPFTPDQTEALIRAARRSTHPRRDEAIILLLLDTGLRASELCGLKIRNVDVHGKRCTVVGKGNKRRSVFFGRTAGKALFQYLREQQRGENEPVFISDRGTEAGEPLTRSGLLQLFERLGKSAKIQATRCSPHTARHTFAVEFLRAGGNVFSLKEMLGHTGLHMTNRYVALASADLEAQVRQFSPADRLRGGK